MATVTAKYLGDLRVECTHVASGTNTVSDAPVANTGKVAFPYMNKILNNWKEKGYTTREKVQGENRTAPRTTGQKGGGTSSRFDFDEFERRSFEIIRQQNGGEG